MATEGFGAGEIRGIRGDAVAGSGRVGEGAK
jgi:hypothetical protein